MVDGGNSSYFFSKRENLLDGDSFPSRDCDECKIPCRDIRSRDWLSNAIIVGPTSILLRFLLVTSFRSRKGEGIRFEVVGLRVVLRNAKVLSMPGSLSSLSSSTQGIVIGGAIEKYGFIVDLNGSTVSCSTTEIGEGQRENRWNYEGETRNQPSKIQKCATISHVVKVWPFFAILQLRLGHHSNSITNSKTVLNELFFQHCSTWLPRKRCQAHVTCRRQRD